MDQQIYARKFIVTMVNGNVFTSSLQKFNETELSNILLTIRKIGDTLHSFHFDHIYMNGKEISSIRMIKPWWISK